MPGVGFRFPCTRRLDGSEIVWRTSFEVEEADNYGWGVFGVGETASGNVAAALKDELAIVLLVLDSA